ncbi:MAG: type II toxin-antitoxin system VapB family antitoxin, partial [Spirochaetaceae bacterium]|nr:type II toxin-antitoxin system VapB family antitoxin [Spirochaetaceae bacterium]
MRTALEIPDSLLDEAMALTRISTNTDVIKEALMTLIQREKTKDLKKYYG